MPARATERVVSDGAALRCTRVRVRVRGERPSGRQISNRMAQPPVRLTEQRRLGLARAPLAARAPAARWCVGCRYRWPPRASRAPSSVRWATYAPPPRHAQLGRVTCVWGCGGAWGGVPSDWRRAAQDDQLHPLCLHAALHRGPRADVRGV
eukprot:scaffold523_cov446-Prasinococcus_capsulatus_cf.AAC.2